MDNTRFYGLIAIACVMVSTFTLGCSSQYMAEQLRIAAQQLENQSSDPKPADGDNVKRPDESQAEYDNKARGVILAGSERRHRFALVIGNARYQHVMSLSNPDNDAFDMKVALQELGFHVTYLPNAPDRRRITEAVRQFGYNLSKNPESVGLFFYAGHAMQINGVNYLIPVEAVIKNQADVEFETFNTNYLLQVMEEADNGMNIIILDACRNNPFARKFRSTASRGLAPMDSPTGSIIAFATAPGRTAEDGAGRNGTFTKHLLKHIDTQQLTIEQMLKRVRVGVIDETRGRQTPWETSSLRGDFCFAGCRDQAAVKAAARREAEEQLRQELAAQQDRLEAERAALESERNRIESKKSEMKVKAAEAFRQKDNEALDKIHAEQQWLTEQRKLLKEEQKRIDKQKEVLLNQTANNSEKEEEIIKLQQEQEKYEEARLEIEKLRAEAERQRSLAEKARREAEKARKERFDFSGTKRVRPAVAPSIGGF